MRESGEVARTTLDWCVVVLKQQHELEEEAALRRQIAQASEGLQARILDFERGRAESATAFEGGDDDDDVEGGSGCCRGCVLI